jgi:hypothetical protein
MTGRQGSNQKTIRNQEILQMRRDGASLDEVAQAFGISSQRVYEICGVKELKENDMHAKPLGKEGRMIQRIEDLEDRVARLQAQNILVLRKFMQLREAVLRANPEISGLLHDSGGAPEHSYHSSIDYASRGQMDFQEALEEPREIIGV